MNISLFGLFCFVIIQLTLAGTIYLTLKVDIIPLIKERNEIRDKETKNKKFELYMNISPKALSEEIDQYVERYINRYIAFKFITKKATFINNDDEEKMIIDLTRLIAIEMSEVYVEYFKVLYAINTQEDLVRVIKDRVTTLTVESVSNFNKSNQILNL